MKTNDIDWERDLQETKLGGRLAAELLAWWVADINLHFTQKSVGVFWLQYG